MRRALLALLIAASSAAAQDARPLASGARASAGLPDAGRLFVTYRIDVPAGSKKLVVTVEATGDADLFVKAGGPIESDWQGEATASSMGDAGRERVELTTDGSPALRATTYYIDVVHGGGREGKPMRFDITASVSSDGPGPGATPLAAGEAPGADGEPALDADFTKTVTFTAGGTNFQTFRVKVGADVASLELTLRGAKSDVDIFARHGAAMGDWEEADARANGPETDETILLTREGTPRLRTGIWFVDVGRAGAAAETVTFSGKLTRGWTGTEAAGGRPEPSDEENVEGEVREQDALFTVDFPASGANFRTYTIIVPKGARSLLVTATGAKSDIDLYLRHGEPMADYREDPDHKANGSRNDENLYVDASSTPPLRPGKYYLDITRAVADEAVGPIEVAVRFDATKPPPTPATEGPVGTLVLGQRQEVTLERSERKAARFRFDVPPAAKRLHVAVFGATRDVDLFLRKGEVITSYDEDDGFDWKSMSVRLNERLTVDATTEPAISGGSYFLDVASLVTADSHIKFTLIVTIDAPPALLPGDVRFPPYTRQGAPSPLEAVLAATVQISCESGSGSGTCITPSGLIVTNYHVLEDEGKLQEQDVLVSFPESWDEPPNQVFVAKVAGFDKDLDLVLLELVTDVLDRPLPQNLRLPCAPIGDPAKLRLGDELLVAGYPSVGGDETRSSVSVTQGIVSGFQVDAGRRTWIKTDARINAGNSGGSLYALDGQRYVYVGVPSMERVEDDDELGFCRPTSLFSDAWTTRIKSELGAR